MGETCAYSFSVSSDTVMHQIYCCLPLNKDQSDSYSVSFIKSQMSNFICRELQTGCDQRHRHAIGLQSASISKALFRTSLCTPLCTPLCSALCTPFLYTFFDALCSLVLHHREVGAIGVDADAVASTIFSGHVHQLGYVAYLAEVSTLCHGDSACFTLQRNELFRAFPNYSRDFWQFLLVMLRKC